MRSLNKIVQSSGTVGSHAKNKKSAAPSSWELTADANKNDKVGVDQAVGRQEESSKGNKKLVLRDLTSLRGKSSMKTDSSSKRKFSAFLQFHFADDANAPKTFDTLTEEYITTELIGSFADWMASSENNRVSRSTCSNYLSSIKNCLESEFPDLILYAHNRSNWRGRLSNNVNKTYHELSKQIGLPVSKKAPDCTPSDLGIICSTLLSQNDVPAMMSRLYILLGYQTLGRVSEIGDLTFQNLVLNTTNLKNGYYIQVCANPYR